MHIGYLGPLEVRDGERVVEVPGTRLRRLLTRLVLDVGRPVAPRTLTDAVWADDAPADPVNALQSLVSRLRRTLGDAGLVEQVPGGYRLAVDPDDVDAVRFTRLAATAHDAVARRADDDAAAGVTQALALWRGEPLADDDDPALDHVRARLDEVHLQLVADRYELELRAGRAGSVVGELEQLVAAHPLREDLAGLQVRALAQVGRPAEALAAYEATRRFLADTLGTDPSPALQAVHLEVLRHQEPAPGGRTNLRAALTSFVGRADDAARVDALLGDGPGGSRLVTVVGPGGSGKTRLAQEVAAGWVPRARDGVWFAELAPVSDADNIALALLDGIGVRDVALLEQRAGERPRLEARARVLQTLADAECLVVVDNCEHVVAAAAELVADVLGHCPGVRIIATSREPLGVDGESLYPLTPLAVPPEDEVDAEVLADVPAVRLLLDRARSAGAPLTLDDVTAPDVVRVVRRLDGLPLAIELAAARLRSLSVHEVAERLTDRFRLLTGGRRTAMARHRTLRAVVEWSWDLLEPLEREVADHFSVFGSGATALAVQAVCPTWRSTRPVADTGPDVGSEVVDVLHALVDKSILVAAHDQGGTRFRMLETLREYGSERLQQQGVLEQARDAHARFYAALATDADARLRGREQLAALHLLDVERDNVLTALAYLGDAGDAEAAVELAVRLAWFWMLRENGRDAARWLRFAMAVPGAERSPLHAVAAAMEVITAFAVPEDPPAGERDRRHDHARLTDRVHHADAAGEVPAGGAMPEEHRALLVDVADRLGSAPTGHQIGPVLRPLLLFFAGRRTDAAELMGRALDSPDPWVRAATRSMRIALAENEGDLDTMRSDLDLGLAEWEAIGDHWGLASMLASRGQLRTLDGDLGGAADDLEQASHHLREVGGGGDDLMVRIRLADLRLRAGDVDGAQQQLDAVDRDHRSNRPGPVRDLMVDLMRAAVAQARGDRAEVERHALALQRTVEGFGSPPGQFEAHGAAWAYAFLVGVDVDRGDLAAATAHLRTAYSVALLTDDLPIIATSGTAAAEVALALGRPVDAAEILGASARLRGSDDVTQQRMRPLREAIEHALGDDWAPAFERGRSLDRAGAVARVDPGTFLGAGAEPVEQRADEGSVERAVEQPAQARRR